MVILFGVGLVPAVLSTFVARALGPGALEQGLVQVIGFLCYGAYFVWAWSRSGQTLPMQTWGIELVTSDGHRLDRRRACLRYLAAWLWVAPAILIAHLAGWSRWPAIGAVGAWAVFYGAWALMHPQRQFLHDALCRTRLVQLPR